MSRMHHGIRANARQQWYRIQAKADQGPAQVLIYGEIGDSWWGDSVSAAQFVKDLAAVDADEIDFHIHSPGGDVFDGLAIANAIRTHKAKTTAYVDGLAASAASFIAIAADETVVGLGTEMMIHDASGLCWGQAEDMAKMAADLDHISGNLATLYAAKAGGTVEDWRAAMLAETWYTAEEAVEAGLADWIGTEVAAAPEADAKFDLSMFAHAGRGDAPRPVFPAHLARAQSSTSAAGGGSTPNPEGTDIMPENFIQGLRQRLGIPAEATLDEDGILAALDEALAEQPEAATVGTLPEGTVTIDAATLADLRASAALGVEARAQQVAEHRNALVSAAINDGRITPARRGDWLNALEKNPHAEEDLASLAPGLVPLEAKGYTGGVEASADDDRLLELAFGRKGK